MHPFAPLAPSIVRSPSSTHLAIGMNELRSRSPGPPQEHDSIASITTRNSTTSGTDTASLNHAAENVPQPNASVAQPGCVIAPHPSLVLTPMSPLDLSDFRYDRVTLRCESTQEIETIERMTISLVRRVPNGWEACEHPEGKLYYRHPTKRILTHVDINTPQNASDIDMMYNMIRNDLAIPENVPMPYDVVIDIGRNYEGILEYRYYLSCWEQRAIAWIENVDIRLLTNKDRPVYCQAHLRHAMSWQFWQHVETFPNHVKIPRDVIREVSDNLRYGWNDLTTSETSTIPFDPRKISELSRIFTAMKEGTQSKYHAVIIARNMATLSKDRFYNYHGQPFAKLNSIESVYKDDIHSPRSLLFLILSPLFFWLPDIYLAELERIWIDDTVNYYHWNRFIAKISRDRQDAITPATVLLTANVGFLAIQSVDDTKPLAQVASYVSTLFSLASYIVGQILARQHRVMTERDDVAHVAKYLKSKSGLYYGLEMPAFAYSLPSALFSWGMLTFLLSILHTCFFHTSMIVRVVSGLSFGFLFFAICVILYMDWGVDPLTCSDIRGTIIGALRERMRYVLLSIPEMLAYVRRRNGGEDKNANGSVNGNHNQV